MHRQLAEVHPWLGVVRSAGNNDLECIVARGHIERSDGHIDPLRIGAITIDGRFQHVVNIELRDAFPFKQPADTLSAVSFLDRVRNITKRSCDTICHSPSGNAGSLQIWRYLFSSVVFLTNMPDMPGNR